MTPRPCQGQGEGLLSYVLLMTGLRSQRGKLITYSFHYVFQDINKLAIFQSRKKSFQGQPDMHHFDIVQEWSSCTFFFPFLTVCLCSKAVKPCRQDLPLDLILGRAIISLNRVKFLLGMTSNLSCNYPKISPARIKSATFVPNVPFKFVNFGNEKMSKLFTPLFVFPIIL